MNSPIKPSWRFIVSCALGTFLEFFDYTLYGYFAIIMSQYFFPATSPSMQWAATWSVFAIGCLVRPFGAILFGHIADRIGRRKVLPYTIMLMAVPTICIGLLPSYAAIGWIAPALLLACRIFQGLSISAEYNGCSIYCIENNWKNPGLLSALTPFSCGLGMLCASLLALSSHGNWRAPFIIAGVVVGIVGWIMRRNLPETTEFTHLVATNRRHAFPLKTTLQQQKLPLLVNIICSAYMGTASYLLLVYMPSYLQKEFAMSATHSLQFTIILTCLEASACLIFGWLADRVGQGKIMLGACLGTICLAILMLSLSIQFTAFLIFLTALTVLLGAFDGPLTAFLPKLFPAETRYSATALGYNIGGAALGGTGPIIVSLLIGLTHAPISVLTWYLSAWAGCALFCILLAKDSRLKTTILNNPQTRRC